MPKKHKHHVTDAEFNTARRQHLELITSLTKQYANVLSSDALVAAGDIALWRCLQNFDPQFGQRVSSSLYRFVHWECLRAIQENPKRPVVPMVEDVEGKAESVAIRMILNDYLSILTVKARRIVEAKFLENRTFAEIARIEGYSKQGIKNIVDRSVGMMSEAAHAT